MSCSKAHKTDNCTQNWLIVSSCFLVAAARALLVALFLCVCVPVRAHWPLEDKAGNAAARCQLPVASCQSRVQRSGKCNTTTRHGNSSTTSSDFNTLDIISGQMSLQYDRRVSSEGEADCRLPDWARHAHKCATLFSTHTETHTLGIWTEIALRNSMPRRARWQASSGPTDMPFSAPPFSPPVRRLEAKYRWQHLRQPKAMYANKQWSPHSSHLFLLSHTRLPPLSLSLSFSLASPPSVSQSINWQAAWQSASRLSSCRLAAVN